MEDRLAQSGTEFDLVAIGMGIRGAGLVPLVERFEGRYHPILQGDSG
jgi:hypothetical protein